MSRKEDTQDEMKPIGWRRAAEVINQSKSNRTVEDIVKDLNEIRKKIIEDKKQ